MTVHDDAFYDAIAALALGTAAAGEARELADHVASCADCRRAYAELREAADLVGYAAEVPVGALDEIASARMKSRVMRAVRDASRTSAAPPSRPWYAYLAVAAALALALLSAIDNATLRSQNGRDVERIAALEARARAQDQIAAGSLARTRALAARVAQIVAPGAKHFAVAGGEVIASGGHVLIALRDLPALPKGKVYQAWTLANGAKAVAPSITFVPGADGIALIELPESAANLAAVAVSVEPAGGSKAPTSKPKFVRALS